MWTNIVETYTLCFRLGFLIDSLLNNSYLEKKILISSSMDMQIHTIIVIKYGKGNKGMFRRCKFLLRCSLFRHLRIPSIYMRKQSSSKLNTRNMTSHVISNVYIIQSESVPDKIVRQEWSSFLLLSVPLKSHDSRCFIKQEKQDGLQNSNNLMDILPEDIFIKKKKELQKAGARH